MGKAGRVDATFWASGKNTLKEDSETNDHRAAPKPSHDDRLSVIR